MWGDLAFHSVCMALGAFLVGRAVAQSRYRVNALATSHRLELLDLLIQVPRSVEELAREDHLSIVNTSQYIQRMKQARLVAAEKEGWYVHYRRVCQAVTRLVLQLRALTGRQLAEVELALDTNRRHEFEQISAGCHEIFRPPTAAKMTGESSENTWCSPLFPSPSFFHFR